MTDVTRAWSILEYFRRNWMEPMWLGCSLERYEEIKSYDDFMAWLDERPEHANSDLGLYLAHERRTSGSTNTARGVGRYVSWGYLPHEDKYNKPTIEGRNAALIMKSGVYDGKTDSFKLMDQAFTREDTLHAWYDEPGGLHPFDRTTKPIAEEHASIPNGKYSWATAVRHAENGRLEAGPLARQMVAGGKHGEAWQHYDPLVLDMYKQDSAAPASMLAPLRAHA